MGTLNMLGLAKRIGARFLLTSTSEVYGDPLEHPQTESYWGHVNPIGKMIVATLLLFSTTCFLGSNWIPRRHLYAGVRSCYDEGKRTAETLTMDYHRGANVEVSIFSCGYAIVAFGMWILFKETISVFLQNRFA